LACSAREKSAKPFHFLTVNLTMISLCLFSATLFVVLDGAVSKKKLLSSIIYFTVVALQKTLYYVTIERQKRMTFLTGAVSKKKLLSSIIIYFTVVALRKTLYYVTIERQKRITFLTTFTANIYIALLWPPRLVRRGGLAVSASSYETIDPGSILSVAIFPW